MGDQDRYTGGDSILGALKGFGRSAEAAGKSVDKLARAASPAASPVEQIRRALGGGSELRKIVDSAGWSFWERGERPEKLRHSDVSMQTNAAGDRSGIWVGKLLIASFSVSCFETEKGMIVIDWETVSLEVMPGATEASERSAAVMADSLRRIGMTEEQITATLLEHGIIWEQE